MLLEASLSSARTDESMLGCSVTPGQKLAFVGLNGVIIGRSLEAQQKMNEYA